MPTSLRKALSAERTKFYPVWLRDTLDWVCDQCGSEGVRWRVTSWDPSFIRDVNNYCDACVAAEMYRRFEKGGG